MPRSKRTRKTQEKREWGKNNPQTKAKNRKNLMIVSVIAIAIIAVSAFVVLEQNVLFAQPTMPSRVLFMVEGTNAEGNQFTGNITIQLRTDRPVTTRNFVNLVEEGFYDNTTFHRGMADFMIQGGQNTTKTVATIVDEYSLGDNHNYNGTIAMANKNQADTADSQFFINVNDNNNLYSTFDTTYTVFGTITSGMDIVMEISHVACQASSSNPSETSQPIYPVTLVKAITLP
jgi:peptidyl-prolyl cis-trans isomerase A (cyclophilin A)